MGIYLFAALFISPKRLHPLARLLSRFVLLGAGQIIKMEGKTAITKYPELVKQLNQDKEYCLGQLNIYKQ